MALDPSEAVEFVRHVNDAESQNRQMGLTALRFRYGDQWPQYAIASRGLDRPQLTINETNTYLKKVTNAQRQQRPRGKAQPVDNMADKKVAKVITGLGRHVEVNSDADYAYDTAFDFAATIGWGYWRLRTDYVSPDSFNQDIYIDPVDNPFCVYFDHNSTLPDGSDAQKAVITDKMRKEAFRKEFPGAQESNFEDRGTGDSDPDWVTEQDIRLAEYFYVERTKAKLVMLTDGTVLWADRLPALQRIMAMAKVGVKGERESFKTIVKWCKQTSFEILEERTLPGRWIPVVPVYWTSVFIDGEGRRRQGLVQDAMDPQRMVNFWQTSITESIALAPKAKWLIAEGQDEGHENEFKNANLSAVPVLRYKPTDVDGKPAPPPQRLQPEPPPSGAIEATFMASQNLSRVMGVFDPAVRGGAQHKSDKTLNAEQGQSENTNFDGYDNLTRSIKHTWRIMLSWFPEVFDTPGRVQRIIGADGKDELVTLNEPKQDPTGEAIKEVLNDVTVGTYDVVMDTGPGYDTLRKEGAQAMIQILDTPLGEKIAATADDLIMRQQDFPGADEIADRLAAANPLSQIDEKSDIPPQAQMAIKGLQQKLQQAQQIIQEQGVEIKYRLKATEIKEEGQTKRALMKETGDAHERQITQAQKQHDTEVYSETTLSVAELNAFVKVLTSKSEHGDRIREMLMQFDHEASMKNRELESKSQETESV